MIPVDFIRAFVKARATRIGLWLHRHIAPIISARRIAVVTVGHPVLDYFFLNLSLRKRLPLHFVTPMENCEPYEHLIIPNGQWESVEHLQDKYRDKHLIFCEVGFFPQNNTVYFDSEGVHAKSSFRHATIPPATPEQLNRLAIFREQFLKENYIRHRWASVRSQAEPGSETLTATSRPYILVPLQLESDTAFNFCPFDSNQEIISALESFFPQRRLIFKPHPLDNDAQYTVREGNSLLGVDNRDLAYLIKHAEYIVGCNSNVLLESLLAGKKCAAFGEGIFSGHQVVMECHDQPSRLAEIDDFLPCRSHIDSFLVSILDTQISIEFWRNQEESEKLSRKLELLKLVK